MNIIYNKRNLSTSLKDCIPTQLDFSVDRNGPNRNPIKDIIPSSEQEYQPNAKRGDAQNFAWWVDFSEASALAEGSGVNVTQITTSPDYDGIDSLNFDRSNLILADSDTASSLASCSGKSVSPLLDSLISSDSMQEPGIESPMSEVCIDVEGVKTTTDDDASSVPPSPPSSPIVKAPLGPVEEMEAWLLHGEWAGGDLSDDALPALLSLLLKPSGPTIVTGPKSNSSSPFTPGSASIDTSLQALVDHHYEEDAQLIRTRDEDYVGTWTQPTSLSTTVRNHAVNIEDLANGGDWVVEDMAMQSPLGSDMEGGGNAAATTDSNVLEEEDLHAATDLTQDSNMSVDSIGYAGVISANVLQLTSPSVIPLSYYIDAPLSEEKQSLQMMREVEDGDMASLDKGWDSTCLESQNTVSMRGKKDSDSSPEEGQPESLLQQLGRPSHSNENDVGDGVDSESCFSSSYMQLNAVIESAQRSAVQSEQSTPADDAVIALLLTSEDESIQAAHPVQTNLHHRIYIDDYTSSDESSCGPGGCPGLSYCEHGVYGGAGEFRNSEEEDPGLDTVPGPDNNIYTCERSSVDSLNESISKHHAVTGDVGIGGDDAVLSMLLFGNNSPPYTSSDSSIVSCDSSESAFPSDISTHHLSDTEESMNFLMNSTLPSATPQRSQYQERPLPLREAFKSHSSICSEVQVALEVEVIIEEAFLEPLHPYHTEKATSMPKYTEYSEEMCHLTMGIAGQLAVGDPVCGNGPDVIGESQSITELMEKHCDPSPVVSHPAVGVLNARQLAVGDPVSGDGPDVIGESQSITELMEEHCDPSPVVSHLAVGVLNAGQLAVGDPVSGDGPDVIGESQSITEVMEDHCDSTSVRAESTADLQLDIAEDISHSKPEYIPDENFISSTEITSPDCLVNDRDQNGAASGITTSPPVASEGINEKKEYAVVGSALPATPSSDHSYPSFDSFEEGSPQLMFSTLSTPSAGTYSPSPSSSRPASAVGSDQLKVSKNTSPSITPNRNLLSPPVSSSAPSSGNSKTSDISNRLSSPVDFSPSLSASTQKGKTLTDVYSSQSVGGSPTSDKGGGASIRSGSYSQPRQNALFHSQSYRSASVSAAARPSRAPPPISPSPQLVRYLDRSYRASQPDSGLVYPPVVFNSSPLPHNATLRESRTNSGRRSSDFYGFESISPAFVETPVRASSNDAYKSSDVSSSSHPTPLLPPGKHGEEGDLDISLMLGLDDATQRFSGANGGQHSAVHRRPPPPPLGGSVMNRYARNYETPSRDRSYDMSAILLPGYSTAHMNREDIDISINRNHSSSSSNDISYNDTVKAKHSMKNQSLSSGNTGTPFLSGDIDKACELIRWTLTK